jgi:hypothetical protein
MCIEVYEDQNTGEAVILLGRSFGFNEKEEFYGAYSQFEPSRHFFIDFNKVEMVDYSSLVTLLLFKDHVTEFQSTVTIAGCDHGAINTFLNLPMFQRCFEVVK